MAPNYDIERVIDSLATISSVLFKRLVTMECNKCEPCGEYFMEALKVLQSSGKVAGGLKGGIGTTGE